jgi:hypothetical protein
VDETLLPLGHRPNLAALRTFFFAKRGAANATPRLGGYEVLPDRAILSKEMPGAGRVFECFGLETMQTNTSRP